MANVVVDDTFLHEIGDAIRERGRTENTFTLSEMPDAIRDNRYMEHAVLIGYAEKKYNLSADTTFDSITPSNTTTQTIRAAQTNEIEVSFDAVDLDAYDIFTVSITNFEPVYKNGNILPRLIKQSSATLTKIGRYLRPNSNPVDKESAIGTQILSLPDNTIASYLYYGTNGAVAFGTSISNNSIIATSTKATIWTSNTPSGGAANNQSGRYALAAKWSPSAVTVRGSTTNFSADAMMDLDSKACEIVRRLYVYRIPRTDRGFQNEIPQRVFMFDEMPETN